jgi:glycosyltransferase involved in cell wall biosynthesis
MKFSIIIPTYSRIDFLERAIQSVIKQTYSNYEIIVVNDNPLDKTRIEGLLTAYHKIKIIHHLQSKGGNAARNSGILNSDGDIIAFLDDDDLWLPEKLSLHLEEHKQHPNVGLVFSNCLFVYNNTFVKDFITSTRLPPNILDSMRKAGFCPPTCSMVSIRRECIEKCGLFDETLVSLQDWDYWFRIAHFFEFSHIPVVLVHYHQHLQDRTSHNENKRRIGLNQIRDKWKNEINIPAFTKIIIQNIYAKNARNTLIAGKKLLAFKKSLKLLSIEVISLQSIRSFAKFFFNIIKTKNR